VNGSPSISTSPTVPDHIDPGRAVAPGASRLRLDEPLSLLPCAEHERRLPRSQRELLGSPPLAFRPHFYCCFGPVSNADVYTSELEETRTASVYARAGPTAALGGDPRPLEGERPTFQRLKRDTVKPLLKCRARSVCKASHILVLPRPMQRSCASCWRWSSARDIQASPAVKPAPCQARWAGAGWGSRPGTLTPHPPRGEPPTAGAVPARATPATVHVGYAPSRGASLMASEASVLGRRSVPGSPRIGSCRAATPDGDTSRRYETRPPVWDA